MDVGAPQDMLEGLKALIQASEQKGGPEFDPLPCSSLVPLCLRLQESEPLISF